MRSLRIFSPFILFLLLLLPPPTIQNSFNFNIKEELPPNSFICDVKQLANQSASPPLTPQQLQLLRFRLSASGIFENSDFRLDGDMLYSARTFDREAMCDGKCVGEVVIQVTPVEYYQKLILNIRVQDINDHPPVFSTSRKVIVLTSDSPIGSTFDLPSATDDDLNPTLTYIIDPPSTYFVLLTNGGTLKLQQVRSLSNAPQIMELTIIVADEGNPPKKSNMAVTLEIKNTPKPVYLAFTKSPYTFSMKDNGMPGTTLLRLEAVPLGVDPPNVQVLYQLDHSVPCANNFRLNSTSGDLKLTQQTSSCSFNVTASIQSPNPTNTSTIVQIYVIKDDIFNVTFLGQGQIKCVSKGVLVASLLLEEGQCKLDEGGNGLVLKKTPIGFDILTSAERLTINKRSTVICSDDEGREKIIKFNTTCLPYFSTSHYKVTLNSKSNSVGSNLAQIDVTNENANFKTSYRLKDNQEKNILLNGKEFEINSPFKTPGIFQYQAVMIMMTDDADDVIDDMTLIIEVPSSAIVSTPPFLISSSPTSKKTTLSTNNVKDPNDNNSIIITAVICATVVVVVVVVVVAVVLVCCRLNRNKPQPFISPSSVSSAPLVVDSSSFVSNSLCDFNKHLPRSGSVSSTDQSTRTDSVLYPISLSNISNNTKHTFISNNSLYNSNYSHPPNNLSPSNGYAATPADPSSSHSSCNLSKHPSSLEVVMEEAVNLQQLQQQQLKLQQLEKKKNFLQAQNIVSLKQDSIPSSDEAPKVCPRRKKGNRNKMAPAIPQEDTDLDSESGASYTDSGFYGDKNTQRRSSLSFITSSARPPIRTSCRHIAAHSQQSSSLSTSDNDVIVPYSNNIRSIITHPFRKHYTLSANSTSPTPHLPPQPFPKTTKRNGIKVGTGLQSVYSLPLDPPQLNKMPNTTTLLNNRLKAQSFSVKKSHVSFSPTLDVQSDSAIRSLGPSPIQNNIAVNNKKPYHDNNNNINHLYTRSNDSTNDKQHTLSDILKRSIFNFTKTSESPTHQSIQPSPLPHPYGEFKGPLENGVAVSHTKMADTFV